MAAVMRSEPPLSTRKNKTAQSMIAASAETNKARGTWTHKLSTGSVNHFLKCWPTAATSSSPMLRAGIVCNYRSRFGRERQKNRSIRQRPLDALGAHLGHAVGDFGLVWIRHQGALVKGQRP